MISAVLIAYNEASLLERCLKSIQDFVDEIVVVDLHSTDQTVEVAKEFGAKIYEHDWVPYADPIRNWAIEKAKGEWILMLDPDEQVPMSLQHKLIEIAKTDVSAVNIPFKNIFFGSWISHTNFWPDKHLRFFRKGKVTWQDRVHLYPKVEGGILELPAKEEFAIVHQSYQTWGQFVIKQKKYARAEADHRRQVKEQFSLFRLFWLPIREFLARYIKHQGYLDGINGLFLVVVLMWYHVLVEWYLLVNKKKYKRHCD